MVPTQDLVLTLVFEVQTPSDQIDSAMPQKRSIERSVFVEQEAEVASGEILRGATSLLIIRWR